MAPSKQLTPKRTTFAAAAPTSEEFSRLEAVPPESEWFANFDNAHTRRLIGTYSRPQTVIHRFGDTHTRSESRCNNDRNLDYIQFLLSQAVIKSIANAQNVRIGR